MKGKIAVTMTTLALIAFLAGCAGVPKVVVPEVQKPATYELGGLYLTTDEKQMSGVAHDSAKLGVGETVVVYARGMSSVETGGKWFELPAEITVNWKADRELEVTPAVGHVVTVKVVKPISVSSYVTVTATTKDGKKIEAVFTVMPK